jgi:hypothetical protein
MSLRSLPKAIDPVFAVKCTREVVVRFRSKSEEKYVPGTRAALNGRRGRIVLCNLTSMYGERQPGKAYLVVFNEPVKPWWQGGKAAHKADRVKQYWFCPNDLKKVKRRRG